VEKLLQAKGEEVRKLAKNLYWFDYLDQKEMETIFNGEDLKKEKVREWEESTRQEEEEAPPLIFAEHLR